MTKEQEQIVNAISKRIKHLEEVMEAMRKVGLEPLYCEVAKEELETMLDIIQGFINDK